MWQLIRVVQDFNLSDDDRLRRLLLKMPSKILYKIAESLDISVPTDISSYELPDYIVQESNIEQRQRLLSQYAYAGNVLCHYFYLKRRTPSYAELVERLANLSVKAEVPEQIFENTPYFEYAEEDETTHSIRIRYRYFRGTTLLYDPETRKSKENLITHFVSALVRPERHLIEVRASHRPVVRDVSYRVASLLSLGSPFTLNLYDLDRIQSFLDWIVSLNNARFEFGESEDVSSISISAKRRVDLRNTQKFQEYYAQGILRGGHATIAKEHESINFRIFFRDGRVYFTSFSSEDDIIMVVDALEKISLGIKFYAPEQILENYFK